MELILLDKQGTKIQASVCKFHRLRLEILPGFVYKISKFNVIPNDYGLRFTNHNYKLIFGSSTNIVRFDDTTIPRECWSFYDTLNIQRRGATFSFLIDFIGLLTAVSRVRRLVIGGRNKKMIVIELVDPVGKIRCVLLGEVVDRLMLHLCSNWTKRPILLLQFVKVRSFADQMIIQMVPHSSQLHINLEAVSIFTRRLFSQSIQINEHVGFIPYQKLEMNMKDEMMNLYPKKTLTQLLVEEQTGVCVTYGGIVGLIRDEPWTYPSCICHDELIVRTGVYECVRCDRFFYQMIRRYRLKIEVFDGYQSAVFVLSDREVKEVMKKSFEKFVIPFEAQLDVEFPLEVEENVIGKKMLFKVERIAGLTYNGTPCYEVIRVCSDLELIEMFRSGLAVTTPLQGSLDDANLSEQFLQAGESINGSCDERIMKRKLVGAAENVCLDVGFKLNQNESEVMENHEKGMLGEIQRMKALKIYDGDQCNVGEEMLDEINRLKVIKISDEVNAISEVEDQTFELPIH
ncbi:uncharacterized protein LOC130741225 [Lotus japonicus]|uniref:uncharacterized protein LOC130741225 n=1 Tax=Lotus japonicus TaxID=34305 RepID=UPI002585150F|nr:uncharacterized protein LOC130741225 [Lotus japonicus]